MGRCGSRLERWENGTSRSQYRVKRSVPRCSLSCATHVLENGADIRFIQPLFGHEELDTTVIYTEVSIKQLQEVHARCHPTAQAQGASLNPGINEPTLPT